MRTWNEYANFNRTLVRWLLGPETPPGLGLRTRLEGTELQVSLLYDQSWEERISQSPPKLAVAIPNANGTFVNSAPTWQRIAPGRYDANVHLPATRYLRGAVQVGAYVLPFGPIVAGANPEWTRDQHRLEELAALSQASGGEERLDLRLHLEGPAPERHHLPAQVRADRVAGGDAARIPPDTPRLDTKLNREKASLRPESRQTRSAMHSAIVLAIVLLGALAIYFILEIPTPHPAGDAPVLSAPPPSTAPRPPSKIYSLTLGKLVSETGADYRFPADAPANGIQYYAIYYSAQWCPPLSCLHPSPGRLVQTGSSRPTHNFELIFVSDDHDEASMLDYMKEMAMPWPALEYEYVKHDGTGIEQYAGDGIPDLVLIDADGKLACR